VLWVATVGVAYLTANIILPPMIVLIGSFWFRSPRSPGIWTTTSTLSSPRRILYAFIVAGVVGVLGGSVLEFYFVQGDVAGPRIAVRRARSSTLSLP
jgi:hypothetical protein